MTIQLPSKVSGPLTVVVERDGERVALQLWPSGGSYWCGRWPLLLSVVDAGASKRSVDVWFGAVPESIPILDYWPADGVPLPDAADGPLLVCYADGATRRVVRAENDIGDGCWCTEGRDVSFDEGHSFALDDDGVALDAPSPVLAWARTHCDGLDRPEMHPGDDPVESLAQEWRVSVGDVRKAMEVGRAE